MKEYKDSPGPLTGNFKLDGKTGVKLRLLCWMHVSVAQSMQHTPKMPAVGVCVCMCVCVCVCVHVCACMRACVCIRRKDSLNTVLYHRLYGMAYSYSIPVPELVVQLEWSGGRGCQCELQGVIPGAVKSQQLVAGVKHDILKLFKIFTIEKGR